MWRPSPFWTASIWMTMLSMFRSCITVNGRGFDNQDSNHLSQYNGIIVPSHILYQFDSCVHPGQDKGSRENGNGYYGSVYIWSSIMIPSLRRGHRLHLRHHSQFEGKGRVAIRSNPETWCNTFLSATPEKGKIFSINLKQWRH